MYIHKQFVSPAAWTKKRDLPGISAPTHASLFTVSKFEVKINHLYPAHEEHNNWNTAANSSR